MLATRNIIVFFLVLGFALGSAVGLASATGKSFAQPCPMHDQSTDSECCKGDCTAAMMSCASKCAAPLAAADAAAASALMCVSSAALRSADNAVYDPFIARPPPPIPIV